MEYQSTFPNQIHHRLPTARQASKLSFQSSTLCVTNWYKKNEIRILAVLPVREAWPKQNSEGAATYFVGHEPVLQVIKKY